LENPENPVNYIPLVTNLVSALIQYSYTRGKNSAENEAEESQSKLEEEVQ
jgi:hypothetical protein